MLIDKQEKAQLHLEIENRRIKKEEDKQAIIDAELEALKEKKDWWKNIKWKGKQKRKSKLAAINKKIKQEKIRENNKLLLIATKKQQQIEASKFHITPENIYNEVKKYDEDTQTKKQDGDEIVDEIVDDKQESEDENEQKELKQWKTFTGSVDYTKTDPVVKKPPKDSKPKKISKVHIEVGFEGLIARAYKNRYNIDPDYAKRTDAFTVLSDKNNQKKVFARTKLCKNTLKNKKCYNKKCTFAHSKKELQTRVCEFGMNCKHITMKDGKICKFLHK